MPWGIMPPLSRYGAGARPGFDEPAYQQWFRSWRDRIGQDPEDEDSVRDAFSRGIEPEVDDEDRWRWPVVLPGGGAYDGPDAEPDRDVDDNAVVPPHGLLDRLAGRMSDMGFGGGEEAKRTALRRAVGTLGSRLASGALKEGLGALAPAVGAAFDSYQGNLAEQRDRRDLEAKTAAAMEHDKVASEYTKALTEQMQGKPGAAEAEMRRKFQERAQLIADRKAVLEGLSPEHQKIMAPFVGSDKWDEYLFKVTGEPPKKPDEGFTLGEGQVRYDAQGNVIARGPAKTFSPGAGDKPWEAFQYVTRGNELVKVNRATGAVEPVYSFSGTGADPLPQRRAIASDLFRAMLDNGGAVVKPDGTRDVKATWDQAWKAAGDQIGEAVASKPAGRRLAPQPPPPSRPGQSNADHILNQAKAAVSGGASDADILRLLRSIPNLYGFSPEQYLARAKALAGKRKK